jgi:hypothetical protein
MFAGRTANGHAQRRAQARRTSPMRASAGRPPNPAPTAVHAISPAMAPLAIRRATSLPVGAWCASQQLVAS